MSGTGCGIRLYQFLNIAFSSTLYCLLCSLTAGNVVRDNQAVLQIQSFQMLDIQKKGNAILNSYFYTRQLFILSRIRYAEAIDFALIFSMSISILSGVEMKTIQNGIFHF